jgi:hypothetical protein
VHDNRESNYELPKEWTVKNKTHMLDFSNYINKIQTLINGKIPEEECEKFIAEILLSKVDLSHIEKIHETERDSFCNFFSSKMI